MEIPHFRTTAELLRRRRARSESHEVPGAGNGGRGIAAPETQRDGARQRLDLLQCCRTPISRLMSRDVICADPQLSVEGLAALLLEHGLDAVPVVEHGRLVGLASTADALRELEDRQDGEEHLGPRWAGWCAAGLERADGFHETSLARETVRAIMAPFALALPRSASVAQAAALMAVEEVDLLPVVDAGFRVVGVLTARDVMRWLANQSGFGLPVPGRGERGERVLAGRGLGAMLAPARAGNGSRSGPPADQRGPTDTAGGSEPPRRRR